MDIKFGTDGWRGVMAREFTFGNVRRVAQAVAEHAKSQSQRPKGTAAVVGYDHRFQSEHFAAEVARVLESNGLPTLLLAEALPTPAVSFLTRKLKALGLVVTASHNPPSYNGIKIKVDGRAASETVTAGVESFLDRANPSRQGKVETRSFRKDYLDYLRSQINPAPLASKLKAPVVIDYMHGAGSGLMRELLKTPKLVEMRAERDPLFGGVNPEPVEANLAALKKRVVEEKAMLGIALDGDADRVAIVDDKGRYLTPCQVFPMILEYLISSRKMSGKIVQSVSMGCLSGRIAQAHGFEFEELPVGFKHVGEQLASGAAAFGGEESGGYAWSGGLPERDGLLTGLLFVEMCVKTGKKPSELWDAVEKKHGKSFFARVDYHIHRAVVDKAVFTAKVQKKLPKKISGSAIKNIVTTDGVKVILEGDYWVLMRPSGTEPLVRTYAESDSPKRTQEMLESAAKWVNAQL
jgi:phosphomannomutase